MLSRILTAAGAFFTGWFTLHEAFHSIPGGWWQLGLGITLFILAHLIP